MEQAARRIEELETSLSRSRDFVSLLFRINQLMQSASDLNYFHSRLLETVAESEHWDVAQIWFVNNAEGIVVGGAPSFNTNKFPELRQATLERRFTKGIGLPGRVWGNGRPLHIESLAKETSMQFPRSAVTSACGLQSGFAFPIKSNAQVIAVVEMFSLSVRKADPESLEFFDNLGSFLGGYFLSKETEQKTIEADVFNRLILDRSYNAFIAMDTRGVVVQWNSRAEKMFGWMRAEVVGKALADFIVPSRYRDAHVKGIFRYLSTGNKVVLDKRIKAFAATRGGRELPIELSIFAIDLFNRKTFCAFIVDLSKELPPPDVVLD